jgi:hypothetical protein
MELQFRSAIKARNTGAIPHSSALPGLLQRKCACGAAPGVSGQCTDCRKNQIVRAANLTGPAHVQNVLRKTGKPLDADTQLFMEKRFGHNFGHVRIHADNEAAESARSLDALAYTVGSNVVFATGRYAPSTHAGRQLLAHELVHVRQQANGGARVQPQLEIAAPNDAREMEADRIASHVINSNIPYAHVSASAMAPSLQRQAAAQPRTETEDCEPALQNDLRSMHAPALGHLDRAITSLEPGWNKMAPADKAAFNQYFDPAGSGDIDEGFVRDVRQKYRFIRANMRSLRFDCDPSSWSLCGTSKRWCTGGRLMWTCFGNLHVCSAAYKTATPDFKIETIIHESVHNALLTTDRAYSNEAGFKKLKPRGGGFWGSVLNFLGKIPVLGILFRSLPGNNDTINNPDSYAGYAMQV